jgi:energy-coupling factor transporter ATP-binding protein EcfA2
MSTLEYTLQQASTTHKQSSPVNTSEASRFNPPEIKGSQRVFLVGRTNSGKSYVARYLLKLMRQAGWRIVIIDPKKDWQGRGEEKREFSDGSKEQRGTIDKPVLVTSFRSFPLRSDISACFLG